MLRTIKLMILSTTLVALAVPAATAQEMTADDILKRLQAQRTRTLSFVAESTPEGAQETAVTAAAVDENAQISTAPSVDTGVLQLTPVKNASGNSDVNIAAGSDSATTTSSSQQISSGQPESLPVIAASAIPAEMEIAFTIDLTIYFDFDSSVLQAKSKTQLTALCQAILADTGEGRYQIIGHTDAKGKASYNKRLSQARADEVVRYMVSDCGIEPARLQAVGQGEERLKNDENPNSPHNRRVEVQVLS